MPEKSDLDTAISRFESFVEVDPNNDTLRIELGDLYYKSARFDEAIACYEFVLQNAPALSIPQSRIASALIAQGKFPEAESRLRALMPEGATDGAVLHNLGIVLYFQQRWDEAAECFAAADAAGLRAPDNLWHLARSLHSQGKVDDAIATCRRLLESTRAPRDKGYLSLLEMDAKNMPTALALAKETLAEDPENPDAAVVCGTAAIEEQEMDRALAHFQRVIERQPDNGRAWLGAGLGHLHESRHELAIPALEKASDLMPRNTGTMVALGWGKLAAQDATGAEAAFRRALQIDRNFGEAHGGLAVALLLQERVEEAREVNARARKLDPTGFGAWYAESILLGLKGSPDKGAALLARALDRAPAPGAKPMIEYIRKAMAGRNSPRMPAAPGRHD